MSALINCHFFSKSVGMTTGMNVILPEVPDDDGREFPTLYLLHGYSDNYTAWTRWTAVERYVLPYRLAVVMPEVQKSYYSDYHGAKNGDRYWAFVSEELIAATRKFFRLSRKREDTFVAGLSMGGFGALKCALNRPDVFSAAGSLSGVMFGDKEIKNTPRDMQALFGPKNQIKGSVNDLYAAAEKTAKLALKPKIYQYCGTDDFLYESNTRFRDFVQGLGYDYTYEESPGGHEWRLWDKYIEKFLTLLDLEKIVEK
jgi:S-formylglutathione hydrolase FrmB